jgi:fucose permease
LSVTYAIIFSLALNSVTKFHGSFAGILCTGIAGGAIISLLIGQLKDLIGLQTGMLILLLPLVYILSISFWAKPMIQNTTIKNDQ